MSACRFGCLLTGLRAGLENESYFVFQQSMIKWKASSRSGWNAPIAAVAQPVLPQGPNK